MIRRCPFCGSRRVCELSKNLYRCATCDAHFDNDPNEGGDFSSRDPSARLEREERLRVNQQRRRR